MPEYIPITVAFKKKSGSKVWLKTFTDQRIPDKIISSRTNLLPKDCEILDLGVGSAFRDLYEKKYKLSGK